MNPYFGTAWTPPSPEAEQVPTPVGRECSLCQVPIAEGDCGILMPHYGLGGTVQDLPAHRECLLAETVGHQVGCCRCCGEWEDTPQGRREMALEADRRLRRQH